MLYTGGYGCSENLYELRGDSIQSLEWFKLDEKLSSHAGHYPAAYPLPNELEVTTPTTFTKSKLESAILLGEEGMKQHTTSRYRGTSGNKHRYYIFYVNI